MPIHSSHRTDINLQYVKKHSIWEALKVKCIKTRCACNEIAFHIKRKTLEKHNRISVREMKEIYYNINRYISGMYNSQFIIGSSVTLSPYDLWLCSHLIQEQTQIFFKIRKVTYQRSHCSNILEVSSIILFLEFGTFSLANSIFYAFINIWSAGAKGPSYRHTTVSTRWRAFCPQRHIQTWQSEDCLINCSE